ncbi:hypothetical protein [Actinoplanes utahensis]|uniref:Uncharacterized protein n=1 Tax=Actinoplanes utahensis TaxID=1869 RepID=A0A0A6UNV5_ACTUT|nr:hypothetical protein [Actinoplanes utahensis]KHD76753.1 hypothetical protein MB27_15840 [Actinoplanes utahensis]GIF33179.1 hypothetical protein Aut01nite_61650 [Actinoplanes utahensis]
MTTLLKAAGDRLLGALVPSRQAAACTYPGDCTYVKHGCSGGRCYYYYQWGRTCYVGEQAPSCYSYFRKYSGCC